MDGTFNFVPPPNKRKKDKKKHVHTEEESVAGMTIIGAMLGGSFSPKVREFFYWSVILQN